LIGSGVEFILLILFLGTQFFVGEHMDILFFLLILHIAIVLIFKKADKLVLWGSVAGILGTILMYVIPEQSSHNHQIGAAGAIFGFIILVCFYFLAWIVSVLLFRRFGNFFLSLTELKVLGVQLLTFVFLCIMMLVVFTIIDP
jgi:hypothetical protein